TTFASVPRGDTWHNGGRKLHTELSSPAMKRRRADTQLGTCLRNCPTGRHPLDGLAIQSCGFDVRVPRAGHRDSLCRSLLAVQLTDSRNHLNSPARLV